MKLIKKHTTLRKMTKKDDCYVDSSPSNRISMIWNITCEIWSLKGDICVKRRLQRNITNLIKK